MIRKILKQIKNKKICLYKRNNNDNKKIKKKIKNKKIFLYKRKTKL